MGTKKLVGFHARGLQKAIKGVAKNGPRCAPENEGGEGVAHATYAFTSHCGDCAAGLRKTTLMPEAKCCRSLVFASIAG